MVGVFMPWQLADATYQLPCATQVLVEHLPAHHCQGVTWGVRCVPLDLLPRSSSMARTTCLRDDPQVTG